MSLAYWRVEPIWRGETVAILGNGPSLIREDVDACRGRVRVIAVNDALSLASWADLHYFCDLRWWRLRRGEPWYRAFRGIRATLENPDARAEEPAIRGVRFGGTFGICDEPDAICTGGNSGYACVNLAAHLGASSVLLLGFDLRPVEGRSHWHGGYPWPAEADHYARMMSAFRTLARALSDPPRSPVVLNCTPGSVLRDFPETALSEALRRP